MKIHSWKEVIRYFLNHDDDRLLWDYATALRSGDGVPDTWKFMITCLIRGEDVKGFGWDIATAKDFLKCHSDDYIERKMNASYLTVPSHFFIHSHIGLYSLAVYYKEALNNDKICDLLLIFKSKLISNDFSGTCSLARKIIEELLKDRKN